MTNALSDKQLLFIHEYMLDMNAAAAARRAGYSPSTRGSQAAALMHNPLVREQIGILMADMFAEMKITARELMRERARIAFFRSEKMFDASGELLPLHEMSEEERSVLTIHHDLRNNGKSVTRLRQPDRQKALAALEKAHAHVMEQMWSNLLPYDEEEALAFEAEEDRLEAEAASAMAAQASTRAAAQIAAEPVRVAQAASEAPAVAALEVSDVAPQPEPAPEQPPQAAPLASPAAGEPYDFRKDPYWMLGGAYRFADGQRPPLPGPYAPCVLPAAAPIEAAPDLPRSPLMAAVRRAFGRAQMVG
jgi:hypothetical protein